VSPNFKWELEEKESYADRLTKAWKLLLGGREGQISTVPNTIRERSGERVSLDEKNGKIFHSLFKGRGKEAFRQLRFRKKRKGGISDKTRERGKQVLL